MGGELIPYAAGELSTLLGGQASKAITPVVTNAIAEKSAQMGGAALSGLLGKESPKIGTVQNTTKALWNTADDVESMLDGKYLGTNDNYFSQFNPTSLSLMDYTGRPADQKKVAGIMRAIKNNEDIIPITVMKNADNTMTVIDGHHRLQAFRQSGKMPRLKVVNNKAEGYAYADKYASGKLEDVKQYLPQKTANNPNHIDLRGVDLSKYAPETQKSYGTGYGGSGSYSNTVERVGSADVAQVDPETLPAGWERLKKYLDTSKTRVEDAVGKARSKITKNDLIQYLNDYGYDTEGTKDQLWQNVKDQLDDEVLDDLYNEGASDAADIIALRRRSDMPSIENVYMGNKGRTGALDAEFSDRLGIGRSNTPMSDQLVTYNSSAQGDYGAGTIGTDRTWATGEAGVSTAAHERLHSFQHEARLGKYDDRVIEAFNELDYDLAPLIHDKDTISKYWGGRKTDYYFDRNEQESRMLQDYLEYKNYTQRYMHGNRKYEYGEEIIPPFDKFFAKLRELSKKGIALPAIGALFGGAALLNGKKSEE